MLEASRGSEKESRICGDFMTFIICADSFDCINWLICGPPNMGLAGNDNGGQL